MRFDINLASQPYQDVQRFLVRWGSLLIGLLVLTIVLVYAATASFLSWRVSERRLDALRQQIAERDQQRTNAERFLNRPENRQVRDRSQFLNAAFSRKAFSWTEIFSDLETLVPGKLRVLSIRPEVTEDNQLQLRLSVSGTARDAAVELVRRLEKSPHFTAASIDSETALMPSGSEHDTIRFDITALYIPSFARTRKGPADAERAEGPARESLKKAAQAKEAPSAGH